MTLNTFPATPTLAWSILKSPNWGTRAQRAISGRELRVSDYVLCLYHLTYTYEVLHDRWDLRGGPGSGPAYRGPVQLDELRPILQFFNSQHGAAIPFLLFDYTDNTTRSDLATPQIFNFAVGNGTTKSFQMASPLLAPVVPADIHSVSLGGSPTVGYTVDDGGIITFGTAPGVGITIGADFTYYYKVRFKADSFEAEEFMYQLWRLQKIEFISVPD